jgi:hypothetical protein
MSDHGSNKKAKTKESQDKIDEIARLQKLLADSEKHNAKLLADSEKRNAKLLADSEKRNAKLLADSEKRNAEYKKRNAEYKKISLEELLKEGPPFSLKEEGSGKSHTGSSAHKPGKAKKTNFELALSKGSLSPSPPDCIKEMWHLPSSLVWAHVKSNSPEQVVVYSTEADISSLVQPALTDAIRLAQATTGIDFKVRHETSLFAQRPDHLVVFNAASLTPLLAVEDKKPWDSSLSCEQHGTVVGQIFDYATALNAFGNSAPFVVLTTFKQSFIYWLDDDYTNNVAANDNQVRAEASFDDCRLANQKLATGKSDDKTPSPPDLKLEPPESPENGIFLASSSDSKDPTCLFSTNDNHGRTLNYSGGLGSGGFGSGELVALLYTAILCAIKANPQPSRTKHEISELLHGRRFSGGALKMNPDKHDYEWGHLETVVGHKIITTISKNRTGELEPCFMAVAIIGAGSTSKVFYALDENGKPWVIKMYVKRTDDKSGLYLDATAFEIKAREQTKQEVVHFETLYPFLKGKVLHKKIIGLHCVVMPFFKPLSQTERSQKEHKIKNVLLESFFKNRLMYHAVDLRWRHVGVYTDETKGEHIVLFDLADLQELDVEQEGDAFKDGQWGMLVGRLQEEE